MRKQLSLFILFAFSFSMVRAQSSNVSSLNDPTTLLADNRPVPVVQTMLRYEPSAFFGDTNTSFKFAQLRVDANLPLFYFQGKKGLTHSIGFGLGFRYSLPQASFLWRFHEVYSFNTNINYTILKPGKYIWMNTLGTGLADDNYTIDNPNIRLLFSTVYERSISDRIKVRGGGVFASINKEQLFVPMLGIQWKISRKVNLFVAYPYNLRLSYRYNKQWQWYASCHRRIETFRISAYNEDLPTETASVFLTKSDFPTGIGFKHNLANRFLWTFELGTLMNRDLYFYNRDEFPRISAKGASPALNAPLHLYNNAGLYFETSLRYIIPNRNRNMPANTNARILQILDPTDADLEEIIIQH